jgi:DNA modification methylase
VVIAGHTRLKAAQELGLSSVPVHIAAGLTEAQVKAYRLADNRTAEDSTWNVGLLKDELLGLRELGFDYDSIGFSEHELSRLLGGDEKEDEIPPIQEVPISKLGDLYQLGDHRLLCGDSTVKENVDRLMNGVKPNLMVTDPPYGVEYDPNWRAKAGVNKSKNKMGKVSNDDLVDWSQAYNLFPGSVAYVWHAGRHASEVQRSIEAAGFEIRCQIIWAKDRMALSRGDYHWQHEPCWYAVRNKGYWNGDRKQTTLWNIKAREDSGHGHSTQKPVECMRRPILNNSSRGQAVYDPFLGSGTTMIAAETEGRVCYGLELNPLYCDVIVKRWENFTGKKAVLL